MKTKHEILQEWVDKSEESLTRIDIRMGFVQNKYAVENKKHFLDELTQLTADKKETEEWLEYLRQQMNK